MRTSFLTLFFSMLFASGFMLICSHSGYAQDSGYGSNMFGFGTNASDLTGGGTGSANTYTRHRSWGQSTGIGSSNSQTTAATVESMPISNYAPTSVSPAMTKMMTPVPLEKITFSQSMRSSPALAPTLITPPDLPLQSRISRGVFEGNLPAKLSGDSYLLYGGPKIENEGSTDSSGMESGEESPSQPSPVVPSPAGL